MRALRRDGVLLSAAALVVLALGLPWSASTLQFIPGWITPSFCVPEAGGGIWCSPAYISPGLFTGRGELTGADSVARVFLVAALVLMVMARGRSRWLLAATASLLTGLLLHGLGMLGGQIAALGAVLLLVYAARRARDGDGTAPAAGPGQSVGGVP